MKRLMFSAFLLLVGASACGDNNNTTDMTTTGDMTTTTVDMTTPPTLVPVLYGLQIDRMGRAGVNTALTAPFVAAAQMKEITRAKYNQDTDVANWSTKWAPTVIPNLAILDVLDSNAANGDGCGNQLGFAAATGYATLGGALADDQVYVESTKTTCTQYLAVEGAALGITALANDCGGRVPTYDTIDTTYSALAAGALSGVSDSIAQSTPAPDTTFPFLK